MLDTLRCDIDMAIPLFPQNAAPSGVEHDSSLPAHRDTKQAQGAKNSDAAGRFEADSTLLLQEAFSCNSRVSAGLLWSALVWQDEPWDL